MVKIIKNKKRWESFAKNDAVFYIDTEAKNSAQFWQKGEDNFQIYILPILKKYNISNKIVLDFGCGIGRHTFPLAKFFQTTLGVDISEEMLKKAREIAEVKQIKNIQFLENNIFFTSTKPVNFIYCVNVFQHIEEMEQIKFILKKFSHLLHGFAYLQFDTRPKNILYRLKNMTPDFLLPKSQRRGIRRIRRDSKKIENLIKELGFLVIEQQQMGTEYHFFLLQK